MKRSPGKTAAWCWNGWKGDTFAGEYMARTNGGLDHGNGVLFCTGHGAGGGSDLDQGDTRRRHFKMNGYALFAQNDWKIRLNFAAALLKST